MNENHAYDEKVDNTTLKKTEIMDLVNGYSMKVLDINRKEVYSTISFRKDGEEYSRETILVSYAYDVKDPNDQYAVYSIHLDKIYDNSFVIDLTYVLKPEIYLNVAIPEADADKQPVLKLEKDSITRTYEWEYEDAGFWQENNVDNAVELLKKDSIQGKSVVCLDVQKKVASRNFHTH